MFVLFLPRLSPLSSASSVIDTKGMNFNLVGDLTKIGPAPNGDYAVCCQCKRMDRTTTSPNVRCGGNDCGHAYCSDCVTGKDIADVRARAVICLVRSFVVLGAAAYAVTLAVISALPFLLMIGGRGRPSRGRKEEEWQTSFDTSHSSPPRRAHFSDGFGHHLRSEQAVAL